MVDRRIPSKLIYGNVRLIRKRVYKQLKISKENALTVITTRNENQVRKSNNKKIYKLIDKIYLRNDEVSLQSRDLH